MSKVPVFEPATSSVKTGRLNRCGPSCPCEIKASIPSQDSGRCTSSQGEVLLVYRIYLYQGTGPARITLFSTTFENGTVAAATYLLFLRFREFACPGEFSSDVVPVRRNTDKRKPDHVRATSPGPGTPEVEWRKARKVSDEARRHQ